MRVNDAQLRTVDQLPHGSWVLWWPIYAPNQTELLQRLQPRHRCGATQTQRIHDITGQSGIRHSHSAPDARKEARRDTRHELLDGRHLVLLLNQHCGTNWPLGTSV
ncbi:hypothetical protein ACFORH_11145 [Amycolatopsis roodepoortensis]|uniref:Transposase n=1 Tax=Amycolatopsis roodepoortensis TaxID=700274 RepID=A0ABR9LAM7_9PSEU|nr:hypothetical protein [Amycolatopsis roodepoortensis]MBE1577741.1 hypothetical protein [Amycolatopsis roodepoortensis]